MTALPPWDPRPGIAYPQAFLEAVAVDEGHPVAAAEARLELGRRGITGWTPPGRIPTGVPVSEWAPRAVELYRRCDVATAMTEIGPERMQALHAVVTIAMEIAGLPFPGSPELEEWLAGMQRDLEEEFGWLLDGEAAAPAVLVPSAGPLTSLTITEVWPGEGLQPF